MAEAVIRFIEAKQPQIFTLENVYFYRKFKSFKKIIKVLHNLGYAFKYWHICVADWGVPQTRNRLILIARRDGVRPSLPPATHAQNPKQTLFGSLQKWVGWYASIEDLIPTLPDSEFAPWQLARLPEEIKESFLPHTQVNSGTDGRWATEPSTTIAAEKWPNRAVLVEGRNPSGGTDRLADEPSGAVTLSHPPRALLMEGGNTSWMRGYDEGEPAPTVPASVSDKVSRPKALLMNKNQTERDDYCKDGEEPAYTVTPGDNGRRRAFIVNDGDSKQPIIEQERPFGTVKTLATGGTMSRAFVVDGKLSSSNSEKILQINMEDEPHGTVVASPSPLRDGPAVAQGRVVQMTPRALARFQSFPDWYMLPAETNKKTVARQLKRYFVSGTKPSVVDGWALEYIETDMDLACKVIGNAVPPLFMQRLAETFIPKRP